MSAESEIKIISIIIVNSTKLFELLYTVYTPLYHTPHFAVND